MNEEVKRARGKLLSKLLLIKSDLQGINKNRFGKETKILLEGIESRVELLIKNLIRDKKLKGGKI